MQQKTKVLIKSLMKETKMKKWEHSLEKNVNTGAAYKLTLTLRLLIN